MPRPKLTSVRFDSNLPIGLAEEAERIKSTVLERANPIVPQDDWERVLLRVMTNQNNHPWTVEVLRDERMVKTRRLENTEEQHSPEFIASVFEELLLGLYPE